jgi:glycosyltransferase involved in cell wall biosynthesis
LIPSLRGGGAERTLINLLKKLDYDRYDVDLIVVSKTGPYVQKVPSDVNTIYLFKNNFIVRCLTYIHREFGMDWFFKKKMEKSTEEYDVGISFIDSNFTDLLFLKENLKRRVAIIHSSYLTHDNYERFYKHVDFRNKLNSKRYSNLDGIYFVSHESKDEFLELFDEQPNMGVIPNLIDREAILAKSNIKSNHERFETFTFCAVGSLIPVKGFDRLIRAAKIVRDRGHQFKIKIAGDGTEEHNLKNLVDSLDLNDSIIFNGFLKNPYPFMKNSDAFIMSSVSEALPTVLCEAMILGLPCIVTNCSGCRGLVNSGEYGLMAEQDDEDLANNMISFLNDPVLLKNFRKQALKRSEIFDDENVLQKYYAIFDGKDDKLTE